MFGASSERGGGEIEGAIDKPDQDSGTRRGDFGSEIVTPEIEWPRDGRRTPF